MFGRPRTRGSRLLRDLAADARRSDRRERRVVRFTALLNEDDTEALRRRGRARKPWRTAAVVVGLLSLAGLGLVGRVLPAAPISQGMREPESRSGWPSPPSDAIRARVVRVIDGDTVALSGTDVGKSAQGGRSSRLIGIDTPEVHGRVDCYGREASAFTKRGLGDREVLIDFDVQKTDRYGRALVYIWTTDGVLFNGRLAAEGYASQMTIPPNVRYAELYSRLVREARESNRGLWGPACTR